MYKGVNTTRQGRILNVPRKPYIHTHTRKSSGERKKKKDSKYYLMVISETIGLKTRAK